MESQNLDPNQATSAQNRRACDECRLRKLACTKEPLGCSRCMREGIDCHYSPQKRMGRPPKRRFVEAPIPTNQDESGHTDVITVPARVNGDVGDSTGLAPPYAAQDDLSDFVSPPFDQGLSFLDENSTPNFDFLDLLPSSYHDSIQIDPQILSSSDGVVDGAGHPFAFNNAADLLGGINFDEPDSSTADMSKALSESLQRHWAANPIPPFPLERTESCSSALSLSTDSPGSYSGLSLTATPAEDDETQNKEPPIPKAVPSVSCGCLSSLYLALDSLTRLPSDVPSAMRVARNATKIAHDVISCPHCSNAIIDDPSRPPPMQAFQNLMFLAALIPSACNAYARILEMLDEETAAAKRDQRSVYFSFTAIGGLFSTLGETLECAPAKNLHNQWLSPDTWRTAMRSMLRIDVYGFTMEHGHSHVIVQNGLKDVVKLLDERSRARHEKMDAMSAEGKMPHTHYMTMPGPYKPVPPEQRNCIKILDAARIALDNLVIA